MNRIRRICRSLAHLTGPPGGVELRASRLAGRAGYRAGGSGLGVAGLFIQDVAAAAGVAAGHPIGRSGQGTRRSGGGRAAAYPPPAVPGAGSAGREWPATTRLVAAHSLLPRTVQLCVYCRRRPAGFWVSRKGDQTVRRPWCLSCCPKLDRDRCIVTPFDR